MGEECVGERVVVGVGVRPQALLELGKLGGCAIRVADVGRLDVIQSVVPGGNVAEIGDGGDAVRVDSRVRGLRAQSIVGRHVFHEVAAHVRADAGHEGRHVCGGVGVARGDDGGRAVIIVVVVEVEEVGGCEAFARANVVRCLFSDGLEVLVCLLCSIELDLSVGLLCFCCHMV